MSERQLLTVGMIAKELGCPVHRVNYILRSRDIRPAARAGNLGVYQRSDVDRIASEIRRIDRERQGGRHG